MSDQSEQSITISKLLALANLQPVSGENPLTNTARGFTQVAQPIDSSHRLVVRVTPADELVPLDVHLRTTVQLAHETQTATRLYRFSLYYHQHRKDFKNVVPVVDKPKFISTCGRKFLLERFAELVAGGDHVDLHDFVSLGAAKTTPISQLLHILSDVARGIASFHRHNFAHLDVSLENVCLTDDHAYLIDFESVLPVREKSGYLARGDLRVPMKMQFLPPEHLYADEGELVYLQGYDVWAFGCIVFSTIFGRSFFRFGTNTHGETVCDLDQVEYFQHNGFRAFLAMYHEAPHAKLFGSEDSFAILCDLLERIFVPADLIAHSEELIVWSVSQRMTMKEVVEHPIWDAEK